MRSTFKVLLPIYIVIFIGFIGYSLSITVFTPIFMSSDLSFVPLHASRSLRTILLGIVLCLYPLGQFISSPILGAFSDRYGRKPILILSLLLTSLMYIIIAMAMKWESLPLLLLGLFFAGLFEGNVAIAQSIVTDVAQEKERIRFFGYIYFSISLAYVIGPLGGGKLSLWVNSAFPFWIVCIILLLNTLWVFFQFQETHPQEKRVHIQYFEAFTNLKGVFNIKYRKNFLINFLLYFSIFGFFRCYPMYIVDEFKVGVSKLSEFIAWVGVSILIVNFWITGFLSKKYTPFQVVLISAFLIAFFLEILMASKEMRVLWVTLFLTGIAVALCLPSMAAFLSESVAPSERGKVMGNNQSLQFFSEAFSGIMAGLFAAVFVKFSLILFGIIAFIAALILLSYYPSAKSRY